MSREDPWLKTPVPWNFDRHQHLNHKQMQFSLKTVLALIAFLCIAITGYVQWDLHCRTWVVVAPENGFKLLRMEHGTIEGTGEFYASETHGVLIQKDGKSCYVLWTTMAGSLNPFDLNDGDKVIIARSFWTRFYDEDLNGYHATSDDLTHRSSTK